MNIDDVGHLMILSQRNDLDNPMDGPETSINLQIDEQQSNHRRLDETIEHSSITIDSDDQINNSNHNNREGILLNNHNKRQAPNVLDVKKPKKPKDKINQNQNPRYYSSSSIASLSQKQSPSSSLSYMNADVSFLSQNQNEQLLQQQQIQFQQQQQQQQQLQQQQNQQQQRQQTMISEKSDNFCLNFTVGNSEIHEFFSPNFPNNYPNNTECERVIRGKQSKSLRIITISFTN